MNAKGLLKGLLSILVRVPMNSTPPAEPQPSLPKRTTESSTRWQKIQLDQMTDTIKLFHGLAVASLGFGVTLLKDATFTPAGASRYFFDASLGLLLLAIAAGVWCTFNRLEDARLTTRIARKREQGPNDSCLPAMRATSRRLGDRTWKIFRWEVLLFSGGIAVMVVSIALIYGDKLVGVAASGSGD